jgi:hypothetical protein
VIFVVEVIAFEFLGDLEKFTEEAGINLKDLLISNCIGRIDDLLTHGKPIAIGAWE